MMNYKEVLRMRTLERGVVTSLSFRCVTLTRTALYVRVDKENSLESSLDYV